MKARPVSFPQGTQPGQNRQTQFPGNKVCSAPSRTRTHFGTAGCLPADRQRARWHASEGQAGLVQAPGSSPNSVGLPLNDSLSDCPSRAILQHFHQMSSYGLGQCFQRFSGGTGPWGSRCCHFCCCHSTVHCWVFFKKNLCLYVVYLISRISSHH